MNNIVQDVPRQLGFADLDISDIRPLPLIASDRWGFPLQWQSANSKILFAVHDWIRGLAGDSANVTQIWADFKRKEGKNQILDSIQRLEYHASDGKTYQREYADDKVLYLLSQYLRTSDDRPMLDEIRQFLAEAGSLLDDWRRNPEKMLSVAESRMLADIARHEKAGLGDRKEIVHLKAELEAKQVVKQLNEMVAQVVDNPDFAKIHNTKHLALFGATAAQIRLILDSKDIHKALPTLQLNTLIFAERQIIEVLRLQGGNIDSQRALNSIVMAVRPLGIYLQGLCDSLGIDRISGKPLLNHSNN